MCTSTILTNELLRRIEEFVAPEPSQFANDTVVARFGRRQPKSRRVQSGLGAAASYALRHPFAVPAIAGGILADKTERFRKGGGAPIAHSGANGLRYLLQAAPE